MKVSVVHQIHDAKGFLAAGRAALQRGMPEGFQLLSSYTTPNKQTTYCVWEGPSFEAVQTLVDTALGAFSKNEYAEVVETVSLI